MNRTPNQDRQDQAIKAGPTRIQRRRTKGWRMPEGAVYVGRPSEWGNPYKVNAALSMKGLFTLREVDLAVKDPEHAVSLYRRWMTGLLEHGHAGIIPRTGFGPREDQRDLPSRVAELRGRDLVCWCPLDQPCHADVLLELANGASDE